MLHALIHNKASQNRIANRPSEDGITSCVFGSLRFMEPRMAWESCCTLLGRPSLFQGVETPTHVEIELWPRWRIEGGGRGRVEPDVYIIARRNDNIVATICIEVKWGSDLGVDQLDRQWNSPDFYKTTGHPMQVLLYRHMKGEIDSGNDRLHVISWHDVARSLKNSADSTWRNDLIQFLNSLSVVDFDGFDISKPSDVQMSDWRFDDRWRPQLYVVGRLCWRFTN